jgi:hypothetical protein
MKESPGNWRKVYKALNVLDYCIKNGILRLSLKALSRLSIKALS